MASGERLQGARGATCMPHVSTAVHTRSKFLATPCVSCFARGRRPASAACIVENKRGADTQLASKVTSAAAAVRSVLGTAAAPMLLIVGRTRALLGAEIGHTPSACTLHGAVDRFLQHAALEGTAPQGEKKNKKQQPRRRLSTQRRRGDHDGAAQCVSRAARPPGLHQRLSLLEQP